MLREEEDVFLRTALTVAILRRREEERKDKKRKTLNDVHGGDSLEEDPLKLCARFTERELPHAGPRTMVPKTNLEYLKGMTRVAIAAAADLYTTVRNGTAVVVVYTDLPSAANTGTDSAGSGDADGHGSRHESVQRRLGTLASHLSLSARSTDTAELTGWIESVLSLQSGYTTSGTAAAAAAGTTFSGSSHNNTNANISIADVDNDMAIVLASCLVWNQILAHDPTTMAPILIQAIGNTLQSIYYDRVETRPDTADDLVVNLAVLLERVLCVRIEQENAVYVVAETTAALGPDLSSPVSIGDMPSFLMQHTTSRNLTAASKMLLRLTLYDLIVRLSSL